SELEKLNSSLIKDRFQGEDLVIHYNHKSKSATITDKKNKQELPALTTFWFAWYAFHPEGLVFDAHK
ncbi:MAG: DUF3179 domain-containing protein, partial [Bacteroidota bacterium]|nr:DUF3179 domain-containing protein [Bacteroidota bacterium]